MASRGRILFIDDEARLCKNVKLLLEQEGYEVDTAESGTGALEHIYHTSYDLIITDLIMPDVGGMEIVRYVKQFLPETIVIVITGYASLESAVAAMREGAYDYVTKPLDIEVLKMSVERAFEKTRLRNEIKKYYLELEERVRARTQQLKEAQDRLVQSEKLVAIGKLSTIVAHEIKNPLASIGGFARLLQKRAQNERKVREIAAIIQEEVVRLERILENLLSITWERHLDLRPHNPNKLIKETLKVLSSRIEESRVVVNLHLDETIPKLWLDKDKIKQVLLNIYNNAIHAMPHGGTLTVQTTSEGNEVFVEISDTGHGIPEEHLEKVFVPFFSTKEHGTGMGLAICNKLIEDHGGRIKVKSQLGTGTTFTIILPCKKEESSPRALDDLDPQTLPRP